MSSAIKDKVHDVGLTEVYSPSDPQVDVIFVHGLNGHPYNSWATHNPEVFWPADLLPDFVEEQHCRILTYGYDANVTAFTDGASKDHIHNHAEHLAARLLANRSVKARERPIIFVAHSLGGLVVKRLLIYCESINNPKLERLRSIYVSTFGILFLGTPHNGSDLAKMGSALQSICAAVLPKKFLDSSPQLVNALKSNNETLQNINRLFIEIIDPLRIYFFHEQKPMDLKGTRQFVVEEDSAAPVMQGVERMGIEKDHSNMCKFEDVNAPGFDVVADAISSYAEEAPSKIRTRWERERRVREYHRQSIASDILGDSLLGLGANQYQSQPQYSQQSSQRTSISAPSQNKLIGDTHDAPYTIEEPESAAQSIRLLPAPSSSQIFQKQPRVAPLLFRPNSIFVGFDIELAQLNNKLSSKKKSQIGTRTVLVCGPPGSGKSHLARQYVWTQQADYPAGIFWVDCKSRQNRDRYYWNIGQALGCLEGDHSDRINTDLSFIHEVRKCLESLQGWLIVFDGVFFDSDEALSEFIPYLPDSTGNNIIYTSVDPTLKNRHRLLNPSWIRMRPLTLRAAQELLFRSLGMHEYSSTQLRKGQELIRFYKCLPLGIHAAAHMLIAQGRALEKFSPSTTDNRLANPFLEIVRALQSRGYREAVTLLVLLSFLSHKVPVVLLHFGTPALTEFECDIESMDRAGGVRKDLDNTISVLLRYGLIERELQTCSVSSPGQNRPSPRMSRTTTATSVGFLSLSNASTSEDMTDLKLVPTRDDQASSESSRSISITIDTLRMHTITQAIVRDEVQANGMLGMSFNRWLVIAGQFLCESYRVAATKLGSLPGQGSVADYREYKAQVTTLWKFLPRSHKDASAPLAKVREQLRSMFHEIREEIQNRSPAQSQSSKGGQFKYVGSVFESSASSADEGPLTPTGDITRSSTWSPDKSDDASESPTHYRDPPKIYSEDALSDPEDDGYATELDELTSTMQSSQGLSSISSTVIGPARSRQALLQAILQGHASNDHRKDLGEFKPMPTVGRISSPEIETIRPRSSSTASSNFPWPFRRTRTGSSAEAALAAVQAKSAAAGTKPAGSRKASFSSEGRESPLAEGERQPLSPLSANTPLPIITADSVEGQRDLLPKMQQEIVRRTSTSPRLANAVLARQAARVWQGPPVEERISITRRYPAPLSIAPPAGSNINYDGLGFTPTGYMSAPMSRDVSRESHNSLVSAPAEPIDIPNSLETVYLSSYNYPAGALPPVDAAMSRSLDFDRSTNYAYGTSAGLEDELHGLGASTPTIRTAPLSAPMSPNPRTRPTSHDEASEILSTSPNAKASTLEQ